MPKRTSGSSFVVPPAGEWNNIVDAGNEYGLRKSLGDPDPEISFPISPTVARLKNESGSAIAAGRVLEIGAKLLTNLKRDSFWFSGGTPAEDYKKIWGVALKQTPNNTIDEFQVSGLALASVDITHVQHTHCDVVNGSTQLASKWHGTAKILCKATGSTGVQDCVIRLGDPFFGPIDVITSAIITAGSSGNAIVQIEGAESSPASTIGIWLDKMHGGVDSASGSVAVVFYYPDRKRYQIRARDCPL